MIIINVILAVNITILNETKKIFVFLTTLEI